MQETITRTAQEIEELVSNNMRLVPYIVNKLNISASWEDFEDIHQVGYVGLVKAAQTWDTEKTAKFSYYAWHCIKNEIVEYLIKYNNHQQILKSKVSSYDAPICYEEENTFINFVVGDADVNFEDFSSFLAKLTNKEKIILNYLVDGYSLEEIGKEFNVTRERIRQFKNRIGLKWIYTYGPVDGYTADGMTLSKNTKKKGKY